MSLSPSANYTGASYLGNIKIIDAYPTLISEDIFNPLLDSTAHNFDFVANISDGKWKVSTGEWVVDKPLVVFGDILFEDHVFRLVHSVNPI